MKLKKRVGLILSMLALSSSAAFGTVLLNTQFGVCTNLAGASPVPDGTLWALIVDTNGDSALPQLALNSGISTSLSSPFWYNTLSLGKVIGGDTVFAMGGFNGASVNSIAGMTSDAITATPGVDGVVLSAKFGFYWFPGVVYTAPGSYAVGQGSGQVGGINTTLADGGAVTDAMLIPATDGNPANPGAGTAELGGSLPSSSFQAVNIIPETSTALLGALGALGLLRRRR